MNFLTPPNRVAQTGSLPFRRLVVGGVAKFSAPGGLEIRDTADWKSALRASGIAFSGAVAQVSNLLSRRLPAGRAGEKPARRIAASACGLAIRDTADWKSALLQRPFRAPPSAN